MRWTNGAACAGGRPWWWLTKEREGCGRVLSIGFGGECIEATAKWRGVTTGVIELQGGLATQLGGESDGGRGKAVLDCGDGAGWVESFRGGPVVARWHQRWKT